MRSLLFTTSSLLITTSLARVINVFNNCPQNVNIFVDGKSQGKLAVRTTLKLNQAKDWAGSIYTDANGASADGLTGTKAGFYGKDDYYYIADEKRLNTGVRITPSLAPSNGFCEVAMCDNKACNAVYHQPPTTFPPPSTTPPTPPLYRCPGTDVGYTPQRTTRFCPSGVFPPPRNSPPVTIHPNGNKSKCLDVRGGVVANGTAVQVYDCNGSKAQQWLISAGYTLISLFDSPAFNVDAGSGKYLLVWTTGYRFSNRPSFTLGYPKNGDKVTIKTFSEVGLPSQAWYYTEDKRIQLDGTGQCLDFPNGSTANGKQVQTWDCTSGNKNQIWTF
ncbi:hypothetical protein H0H87_012088 [Tephrocybe sp. NHM501043]|nr:hypothetical protein H0H87_012088 [Tephrocybe sp. NHM501043]